VDRPLKLKNKSSQIHGGTYDDDTGRMVLVLNGATVAYHNVDAKHAVGIENADSHGDYFHKHIRPHHQYSRVR